MKNRFKKLMKEIAKIEGLGNSRKIEIEVRQSDGAFVIKAIIPKKDFLGITGPDEDEFVVVLREVGNGFARDYHEEMRIVHPDKSLPQMMSE